MKLILTIEVDGTEDQIEEIADQLEELAAEGDSLKVCLGCFVDLLTVTQAPSPCRRPKKGGQG